MPAAPRALVADDHPLTREGLDVAVRAALPGVSVDHVGALAEAETLVRRHPSYRLIVLDYLLPDTNGFSGLMTLQHLAFRSPVVIVTARRDPALAAAARALGAAGFLSKSAGIDAITSDLRTILQGGTAFPDDCPATAVTKIRDRYLTLSAAQRRVLLAMAGGQSNKVIAATLGVTEATVKAHLSTIFKRMGVTNRAQALLAMQPIFADGSASPNPE